MALFSFQSKIIIACFTLFLALGASILVIKLAKSGYKFFNKLKAIISNFFSALRRKVLSFFGFFRSIPSKIYFFFKSLRVKIQKLFVKIALKVKNFTNFLLAKIRRIFKKSESKKKLEKKNSIAAKECLENAKSKSHCCSLDDIVEARKMIAKSKILVVDMLLTKWLGILGIIWVFITVIRTNSVSFDNIGVLCILGFFSCLCVWPMMVLYGKSNIGDRMINLVQNRRS